MKHLFLLVLLVLSAGCALEPVDLLCDAATEASADPAWAAASPDEREALVGAAWPGGGTADIWREVPGVAGFERWMRAGLLRDHAPDGTKNRRRCQAAIDWLAQDNWERNGLTVALGCDGLWAFGRDGSRHDLGGWPPADEQLRGHLLAPLFDATKHDARAFPEVDRATVVLPASYAATLAQVVTITSTLRAVGIPRAALLDHPAAEPVQWLLSQEHSHEQARSGPFEEVVVRSVQVHSLFDGERVGVFLQLELGAQRDGAFTGLALLAIPLGGADPAASDPWLAAERAAHGVAWLVSDDGCTLLELTADEIASVRPQLVERLRPFDLGEPDWVGMLPGDAPLALGLAVGRALVDLGVDPMPWVVFPPPSSMGCVEALKRPDARVVRSPAELSATIAELRAAAEQLYPTADPR